MELANVNGLLIRRTGPDNCYVIERGGGEYWTGDCWSRALDAAMPFRDHRTARRECLAIQREQYRGLPARTFKVEAVVTLVAPDVEQISMDRLADFISDAVRIDAGSDGPVSGSYVAVRLRLGTLEETGRT